jgi:Predicted acid phosphatase
MTKRLQGKKILLTNDDGIHAPGMKVMEDAARQLSDDVITVAPSVNQSGMAHALTLHSPFVSMGMVLIVILLMARQPIVC